MTHPLDPLEAVRATLLNARLDGSFNVRRVEGGIRVDLRWESYARDVAEALRAAGFTVEKLEAGAALVRPLVTLPQLAQAPQPTDNTG